MMAGMFLYQKDDIKARQHLRDVCQDYMQMTKTTLHRATVRVHRDIQ